MKRAIPWSDEEGDSDSSSGKSSDSPPCKKTASQVKSGKSKSKVVDFEALKQHGYKGGPSVLGVPPPKAPEQEPNWTWSTGREDGKDGKPGTKKTEEEEEESYEQRQKTRAALASGEKLETALTRSDKRNLSFSQKEKRKRELGQASKGKNYVEEEKRLLREVVFTLVLILRNS